MERFTVYSKENCQPCRATCMKLDKLNIPYDVVDLEDKPELVQHFIEEGFQQTPVVDTGMEKWSGYRPDRIGKYAIKLTEM